MVFCEAEVFKVVFCEADGVVVCKEYNRSTFSTASIIAFADSCDVKILVVMFGEIVLLGCSTTIAVVVVLGVLFGSLTGLLGGVT